MSQNSSAVLLLTGDISLLSTCRLAGINGLGFGRNSAVFVLDSLAFDTKNRCHVNPEACQVTSPS
jgi:hypothetical protein